jgi:hypothetical protein
MLEDLIKTAPPGSWQDSAAGVLHLLTEQTENGRRLAALEEKARQITAERDKARQDNEQLQRGLRLPNEQCRAELAVLQQENEQLKKDMQLLKNLEIQLNAREKERR